MVTIQFSDKYKNQMRRIQKLPEIATTLFRSYTKKDATEFIRLFQRGLKTNSLANHQLKTKTIEIKQSMNLTRPDMPLYGKGEDEKNSLYNGHFIKKLKNGYSVKIRKAKHHEKTNMSKTPANISIEKLMILHERGFTTIVKSDKKQYWFLGLTFGLWKRIGSVIRVPARPARRKAYNQLLQNRLKDKRERGVHVRRAIRDFIKGNISSINRLIAVNDKDYGYEKND